MEVLCRGLHTNILDWFVLYVVELVILSLNKKYIFTMARNIHSTVSHFFKFNVCSRHEAIAFYFISFQGARVEG